MDNNQNSSPYEDLLIDYQDRLNKRAAAVPSKSLLTDFNQKTNDSMSTSTAYAPNQQQETIASNIQQTIGQPIAATVEKAQSVPVLGWLTNTALNVAQAVGQYVIDPAMRVVSTAALVDDAIAKGKGIDSLSYAWNKAENISPGQAIAADFMLSKGEVFNEQKRIETFEDNWFGVLTSGGIDLAINILGSKGTGAIVRGSSKMALGSNIVTDMSALRKTAEDAITWAETGATTPAPTAWAQFVDDAVKATDAGTLRSNPFVQNSTHPDRLASLLSKTNTHRGVTEILMAERGDIAALNRLRDELPLAHDALTNFGFDISKPLPDFTKLHELPDPAQSGQYMKLLDEIAKTDKQFAKQLDAFVSDTASATSVTRWQPSKFAAIDKLRMIPKNVKTAALMGDLSYINNGWNVSLREGDRYTRGIRFFQWAAGNRPQGHVNVSNPRIGESVEDIVSEINRVSFLKDDVDFKENMVRLYTNAANDIERAKALGAIERNIIIRMADHYDIGNVRTVFERGGTTLDKIGYLENMWKGLNERRDSAMNYLNQNKFFPDSDGNLNFVKGVKFKQNLIAQSTEPVHVPMLDFRRLEHEVIATLDDLNKSATGRVKGKFDISGRQVARTKVALNPVTIGVQQFGDMAQMLFSNAHLLRLAFIPKNSALDPWMRANMALNHALGLQKGGAQLIGKTMASNARRRALTIPAVTVKGRYSKEAKLLAKDIENIKSDLGQTEIDLSSKLKDVSKSKSKLDKLDADRKAVKGKDAAAVAERQRLDDLFTKEKNRFDALELDAQVLRSQYDNFTQARRAAITQQAQNISRIYDEKAAIDFIGKEKFTYKDKDGNIIEVEGAFDPNARGASAYRAETDSWMNFYATQRSSEMSMRSMKETGWQEIVPDTSNKAVMADYYEAVSHIINRNIRQELDLVLGKLTRGEDVNDVLKWMRTTPAGREYTRRISPRISDSPLNMPADEEILSWLNFTKNNIESILPSKELRELALVRNVNADEAKAYLEGFEDSLIPIYGPTARSAFKSATLGQKAALAAEALPRKGWQVISEVENKLVRMPLFNEYWKQEMRDIADYLQSQGTEITYDLMNGAIRQQAYRKALDRVEQTLYSSRRLTNGGYAMRYLMAFPAAFFNSQKVALKAMARNPWNAYWYNSVQNMMDSPVFGSYYEDNEGNIYQSMKDVPKGTDVSVRVHLPIVGDMIESKLKEYGFDAYLDPQLGGMKINQKQLQFMLGDPGISWIGAATVSSVIKHATDKPLFGNITGEEIIQGLKDKFGEDFYNQSIMFQGNLVQGGNIIETLAGQMVPSYGKFFLASIGVGWEDIIMDEATRLYQMQYRDWLASGSDPAKKPNYEYAVSTAKNIAAIRGLIAFGAPLSTTFDPASREATANFSKLMDNNDNDYQKATDEYVKLYGWESIALLGSSSYRPIGQGATLADQQILNDHKDLIASIVTTTENPESARMLFWITNGDTNAEYDKGIAGIQAEMTVPGTGGEKLIQQKTPQQVRDDIETRIGWYEYTKLDQWRQSTMESYGITSTSSSTYMAIGLRDKFIQAENALRVKYPAWDTDREFNRQGWYTNTGAAINTIINNQKWMDAQPATSELWNEVAYFMNVANTIRNTYDTAVSSVQQAYAKSQFETAYYKMIASFSPQFGQFASRYLANHPLLSIEE